MDIEIDQQQKFAEQFTRLVSEASLKFKLKWDNNIYFINPTHKKMIPGFNPGAIDLLSTELRKRFEILRDQYFHKSL